MEPAIPYWVPIATTFAGGAFVAGINFFMRWQDRVSEEKKHLKELVFRSAVEEWKQQSVTAVEIMKMNTGKKIISEPLVTYIIHLLKLSEVLIDGNITKGNLPGKLTEVDEIMKEVKKFTALPKKENEQKAI